MVRLAFDQLWIPYYPSSKAGNDKTQKKGSVLEAPLGLIDRKLDRPLEFAEKGRFEIEF